MIVATDVPSCLTNVVLPCPDTPSTVSAPNTPAALALYIAKLMPLPGVVVLIHVSPVVGDAGAL